MGVHIPYERITDDVVRENPPIRGQMACLRQPMVQRMGYHAARAGAHHPRRDRRRHRARGHGRTLMAADPVGERDGAALPDGDRHHMDHRRPIHADPGFRNAARTHAPQTAVASFGIDSQERWNPPDPDQFDFNVQRKA